MADFIALVLNGLSVGATYALVALGMVIVFKATEVLNFAHPSLLVVGTLIIGTAYQTYDLPFWIAAPLGIIITALLGVLIDRVLVRPFHKRQAMLAAGIMTIGLSIFINTLMDHEIGAQIIALGDPWGSSTTSILDTQLSSARVAAFIVAAVLLIGFYLWLQRSNFGVAMRAAADDPETAALMGIRLSRVSATAWGLAAALAVVAGIFLVAYPSAGLDVTVTTVALNAIPAAIIGGLDSTTGAVVGGLLVGITQVVTLGYQENLLFLGRSFSEAAPYILMLVVLLVRPAGLFGTKEVSRV